MEDLKAFIQDRSQSRQGQASVVFFSLLVLNNRMTTVIDKGLDDITLKQLMLLIVINISKASSITELGLMMGSSRQNIKNLAVSLERKGYVSIQTDPQDRRAINIVSTEKTYQHFSKYEKLYEDKLEALFQDFTNEEISQLLALFEKFYRGVERMED